MRSIVLIGILLATSGCPAAPPVGPGTDYPCGVNGHACSADSGGGCCDEEDACGHDTHDDPMGSCPVGSCCFIGPQDTMVAQRPRKH